jgi:bacterioferritin-associated ferredoxin
MFVCLCNGITSQTVSKVVAEGASTTKEIAETCGAGADCGRCRHTLRAILNDMGCRPGRSAGPVR